MELLVVPILCQSGLRQVLLLSQWWLGPNGASCGNCKQEQAANPAQKEACCDGHVAVSALIGCKNSVLGM